MTTEVTAKILNNQKSDNNSDSGPVPRGLFIYKIFQKI